VPNALPSQAFSAARRLKLLKSSLLGFGKVSAGKPAAWMHAIKEVPYLKQSSPVRAGENQVNNRL